MWDLPRSGIGPMFPALIGGYSTTEPLGKPCVVYEDFVCRFCAVLEEHA